MKVKEWSVLEIGTCICQTYRDSSWIYEFDGNIMQSGFNFLRAEESKRRDWVNP